MATLSEVDEAVQAAHQAGASQIILLKCTSAYPAPPEEMHLRTIPHLAEAFGAPGRAVGSQPGNCGTCGGGLVGRLHGGEALYSIQISRQPDSAFSLEPHEFKGMVEAVRVTETGLGKVSYEVTEREAASRVFSSFLVCRAEHARR